jgi:hypothetical protein
MAIKAASATTTTVATTATTVGNAAKVVSGLKGAIKLIGPALSFVLDSVLMVFSLKLCGSHGYSPFLINFESKNKRSIY